MHGDIVVSGTDAHLGLSQLDRINRYTTHCVPSGVKIYEKQCLYNTMDNDVMTKCLDYLEINF